MLLTFNLNNLGEVVIEAETIHTGEHGRAGGGLPLEGAEHSAVVGHAHLLCLQEGRGE